MIIARTVLSLLVLAPPGFTGAVAFCQGQGLPHRLTPSLPKPLRDPGGLTLLRQVLTVLADTSGQNALKSCVVRSELTSVGRSALPFEWTVEPHDTLTVVHTDSADLSFGSRVPLTVGSHHYLPSERLNRAKFVAAAAPLWLGRAFLRDDYFVSQTSSSDLNGHAVQIIHIADHSLSSLDRDSQQTWYFDAATFLPLRAEYILPSLTGPGLGQQASADFSGFTTYAAGLYPTEVTLATAGETTSRILTSSVECSTQVHDARYFASHGRSNH